MATKIEKKENTKYKCQTCGKTFNTQVGNFSPNKASQLFAANNGYICTCRNCVEELYNKLVSKYEGNEEKAIERICQLFDFYYGELPLNMTAEEVVNGTRIGKYISKLSIIQNRGKTYETTIEERKEKEDKLTDLDIPNVDEEAVRKAISVWGVGFTPEQYDTLNNMFDDWKARVVIDGKTRESLVRELCIIKLQMNLAIKDNDTKSYTNLMTIYQSTMRSANLQPIQEDANDKASEKPVGVMIKMFEDERPVPKPLPEWEDVDGIVKYITVYFLGHLCKMLKIRNRYSQLYEDEMNKYRVEIPEYEESEDEDIFDSLISGDIDVDSLGEDGS